MFVGQMFLGQLIARIWELLECYWNDHTEWFGDSERAVMQQQGLRLIL